MAIHDWTRVDAGIFHHFRHGWIEEVQRALNSGLLPEDYYALAEQHAAGFGPDVLTLQGPPEAERAGEAATPVESRRTGLLPAPPKVRITAETDMPLFVEPGFYVNVPLEATYRSAFLGVPRRWRRVLDESEA